MPRRAVTEPLYDRILQTSTALFAEHGVDKTSMRMIAESLGVTKAALYYYFDNKDDLHFQIQARLIASVLEQLREIAASEADSSSKVHAVIELTLRSIAEHHEAFTILLREGRNLSSSPNWAGVAEQRAEFRTIVSDIVRDGTESGELDIEDVDVATLALLGMCNWAYTWLDRDGRLSVDTLSNQFARLFLDGARSTSG